MCADGMMDKHDISQVYGVHNWPNQPFGAVMTRPGPLMAAADTFTISIQGRGSHAAHPSASIDPVMVAVQMVQAFQTIVSRRTDPADNLVLSVTQIHAGTTDNVIPDTAMINGTVRTLKPGLNKWVEDQMTQIMQGTADAFGAEATLAFNYGYPVTVNDADKTGFAGKVAADVVGQTQVDLNFPATMGAEDFSYMLEERPGAYIFLGQGDSAGLHHPEYDFNDELSPIGASYFVKLVETAQPVG